MKTFLLIASLTTAGASAFASPGYEPFSDATGAGGTSYTTGANLVGQVNANYAAYTNQASWYLRNGPVSTGGQPIIGSAGLSYAGLSTSGGGSATFGPNGNSALMNLTTTTTGILPADSRKVYFSYLLRLTDITGLSAVGARITGVDQLQSENNPTTPIPAMGGVVMVRSDGATGFNVGIDGGGKGGTHATIQWDSASYTPGDTLFLVGSYDFGETTATGFGELWINPDSGDFGAASAPTADLISSGNSSSLARVASIILLQDNSGATGDIDDLRIDTSWAGVTPAAVPEPSPFAFCLFAVAAWVVFLRFRRLA